jgi:SagB-type dehydrogenase family enzyme
MERDEYDQWLRYTLLARSDRPDDGLERVRTILARIADHKGRAGQQAVRFRRAASLVFLPHGHEVTVYNFVTRRAFVCASTGIRLLLSADDWRSAEDLSELLGECSAPEVGDQVARLVELNALVVEGTKVAAKDEDYRSRWRWGPVAGLYHFSVRDASYSDEDQLFAGEDSPLLFRRHTNGIALPMAPESENLWRVLRRRRTERLFSDGAISKESLAAIMFGGFGITGFIEDAATGRMPLTMSPSGGALNPFEGYVLVRAVDELAPGVYHYSGFDHSLELVRAGPAGPAGRLLAGQQWADSAAAVVFFVANFGRTMWKYRSPVSYRVVMIEAGHIGQNIQLVATERELLAAPTCALRESMIEELLGIDAVDEAVVYAIALGNRRHDDRL